MNKVPLGTLGDYQAFVKDFCDQKGWDKRTPTEKMLFLTEEVGELAKEIRKQAGTYGYKKPETTIELSEELIDVLNYVIDIANMFEIDLEEAFRHKWSKNLKRSWA